MNNFTGNVTMGIVVTSAVVTTTAVDSAVVGIAVDTVVALLLASSPDLKKTTTVNS